MNSLGMTTKELASQFENTQFLTRMEAHIIARSAVLEFGEDATAHVEEVFMDMILAEGSPNAIYNAVMQVVERHESH